MSLQFWQLRYGIGATPGETVSVALKANPTPLTTSSSSSPLKANPTALTTSSSSSPPRRVFANVQNDGSWKALLPSQQAGGDYMVTATSGSDTVTLQNVTFGDVYFCSGYVSPCCTWRRMDVQWTNNSRINMSCTLRRTNKRLSH